MGKYTIYCIVFGFRKGMGTRDAIGTLRVLTEKSIQNGQDVYICFVDYEKAFDRVEWRRLLHGLRRMGIDWRDRRLIENLYMGQQMRVRIDGEYSEPGKVGRGVRQGCPLSPLLFNIYIYRRACTRSGRGSGGGDKGRRKMDLGTEVCRRPSDGS